MAELLENKCKNCGGELDVRLAVNGVIECKYCHTPWTIPKAVTSPAALQFLRMGEHDLDTCKFDDALAAYKKASELDSKEPESYFGMALAEFKIQYLKDHVNNRLQPICHEVTENKFTDDVNYMRALLNATAEQRKVYEDKGAEIDYILGEFFKLKKAKVNYDCFICVKVTDDTTKQPTEDSKDADYIYRLLQDKGYKPFYSERELRNITGADYEARILYALSTSECMLVVCRKEEYLQTPWVKNEYTRFLKLVNDEEKESDSIAIVFYNKPIERLPGRSGKLQGINFALRESDGKIADFVENHTPEARKKRVEEAAQKEAKEEEIRNQIEKQQKAQKVLEEKLSMLESQGTRTVPDEGNDELLKELRLAREAREKEEISKNFDIVAGVLKKYKGSSKSVVIPNGVISIGEEAFANCKGLTEITIPNSVTSIGNRAFESCAGLTEITIPNSVTSIGNRAFESCAGLTEITIPNSVTSIESFAFMGCTGLTEITIPNGVTSIEACVFEGCVGLVEITIPNSVTSIGVAAFRRCIGLKGITIPNSVTSIGKEAFVNCKGLTEITIPDGVTSIEEGVFWGCSGLKKIRIPKGVVSIGYSAFWDCRKLTSIAIPNGVRVIQMQTFYNCVSLASIEIPDSVIQILRDAFKGCTGLTKITISKKIASISNNLFDDCTNLRSVTIPKRFDTGFMHSNLKALFKNSYKNIHFTFI